MTILGLGLAATLACVLVVRFANEVANRGDPATYKLTATITVGRGPDGVAAGAGAIWVIDGSTVIPGTVSRIEL